MCKTAKEPKARPEVGCTELLAELQFYRFEAKMRAKCDDCETRRVPVALGNDGLWRCYECTRKANAPDQARLQPSPEDRSFWSDNKTRKE